MKLRVILEHPLASDARRRVFADWCGRVVLARSPALYWRERIHISCREYDDARVAIATRAMRGHDRVDRPCHRRLIGGAELLSRHENHIRCIGQTRDSVGIEQIAAKC